MLKKLYKHEFQALARFLIPAWGIVLAFTVCSRLIWSIEVDHYLFDIMKTWLILLSIAGIVVIYVVTLALTVARFFKHMLTKEGYLTFTLPFTAAQHITCKLICGILSFVATTAVAFLAVNILSVGTGVLSEFYTEIFGDIKYFFTGSVHNAIWFAMMIVLAILSVSGLLLELYACMGLGSRIMKNKLLGSIVVYLILYFAQQILGTVGVFFIGFADIDYSILFFDPTSAIGAGYLILGGLIVYNILYNGLFYYLTWNSLEKHLNLE